MSLETCLTSDKHSQKVFDLQMNRMPDLMPVFIFIKRKVMLEDIYGILDQTLLSNGFIISYTEEHITSTLNDMC